MSEQVQSAARMAAIFGAFLMVGEGGIAEAQRPQLNIISNSDLRFGSFVVLGSGSRTVSPNGAVTDVSLIPAGSGGTGPARFTISYDRGNRRIRPADLEFEVVFSSVPLTTQGGVQARVSSFQSDLPGYRNFSPGQIIQLTLQNCRTRICSRTFNVGARLDVQRNYGGAQLNIPLPVDAALISIRRSR